MSAFSARQNLWAALSASAKEVAKPKEAADQTQTPSRPESQTQEKGKRKLKSKIDLPKLPAEESVPSTPVLTPRPLPPSRPESPKKTSSTRYSSFNPTKKNFQQKSDGRCLINAAEGERLVILGSYGIRVRQGQATIAGAILVPSETIHWVHAPHCHALPILRATSDALLELHPHPAAQTMRKLARLNPAFGKLWNETTDEPPSGKQNKTTSTFQIIYSPEDVPKRAVLQDLVSPPEWNKKLAGLVSSKRKSTPVIFLCGPKSSGKSTFGRLLANRLITDQGGDPMRPWSQVAILDIDPGQPEFGPPGVISLNIISAPNLSPSFCHPTLDPARSQPRAHAIASVTPALDPTHFVESVLDLFSHYKQNPALFKHPLIINTPGWIQGTGLDILCELVKGIKPAEVIYMSQDGPEETVDSLRTVCADGSSTGGHIPFHTLPSQQSSDSAARTSLHLRTMQAMSYFHLKWASLAPPSQHHVWNPVSLSEIRPWRVRYRGPNRGFVGVLCYDYQPAPDLLSETINGMFLALVRVDSETAFRDLIQVNSSTKVTDIDTDASAEQKEKAATLKGIMFTKREGIPMIQNPQGRTLDPRHSRCLGLVLVRGIDSDRGELQLLTPMSKDVLRSGDDKHQKSEGENLVLVAGKFDTPSWAYAEDLHKRAFVSLPGGTGKSGSVPTFTAEEDADAAEEMGVEEDEEEKSEGDEETENIVSEDESEQISQGVKRGRVEYAEMPWVEKLHGSQKRSVGSTVWRVRRDLGRSS